MAQANPFFKAAMTVGDAFWDFLELKDILNISTCSRAGASLVVPVGSLNRILRGNDSLGMIGKLKLNFPVSYTTGMVRRVFNRLSGALELAICVDDHRGRVVLDIGSAFHDKDAILAEADPVEEDEADVENQQIFKQLEICSMDEYDDFNPRHPMPKDRAHRRGDSYFNSDIEMVVGEIGAMDLSNIAAKAALFDEPGITPPLPPAPKQSAKEKMMEKRNKIKNNYPGRPPAQATLREDDEDEDN
jgi:hypothetical protein